MVLDNDSSQDSIQLTSYTPILADVSFSDNAAEESGMDSAPSSVGGPPAKK